MIVALALWRSILIGLIIGGYIAFAVLWWHYCNDYLGPRIERWLRRRCGLDETSAAAYGTSPTISWPTTGTVGTPLKFMPPGHFCPDVCGLEDFGPADFWRGRIVRGFFRAMSLWPKPTSRTRRIR